MTMRRTPWAAGCCGPKFMVIGLIWVSAMIYGAFGAELAPGLFVGLAVGLGLAAPGTGLAGVGFLGPGAGAGATAAVTGAVAFSSPGSTRGCSMPSQGERKSKERNSWRSSTGS